MSYQIVQLRNGAHAVYSAAYDEKMHPGLGPAEEAEKLYVNQLKLPERLAQHRGEFVVWDVGLGAAANAVAALRAARAFTGVIRLVSFDNTPGPLEFALENAGALEFLNGYQNQLGELLRTRTVEFANGDATVKWNFVLGDFPTWLSRERSLGPTARDYPAPHVVLFDAFSPAKNPAMWTLPLFTDLFAVLDAQRPCSLATYTRSTMVRVSLLLAGFFVGRGVASGLKDETTVAANSLSLLDHALDRDWLKRVWRSKSAEPLSAAEYRQEKISETSRARLAAHPQFAV